MHWVINKCSKLGVIRPIYVGVYPAQLDGVWSKQHSLKYLFKGYENDYMTDKKITEDY